MHLILGCHLCLSSGAQKQRCLKVWVDYFNVRVCVCVCSFFPPLQDLRYFKSDKTSRGILQEGWRDTQDPIMCSYKLVTVKFEVWGLQTRVEQFVHKVRGHPRDEYYIFHCINTLTVVLSSSDASVRLSVFAWLSSRHLVHPSKPFGHCC